jgi:hypothetical protein
VSAILVYRCAWRTFTLTGDNCFYVDVRKLIDVFPGYAGIGNQIIDFVLTAQGREQNFFQFA